MRESRVAYFEWAAQELEKQLLQRFYQRRPLTENELADYSSHEAVKGWRLADETPFGMTKLDVVLPHSFPFDPPRIIWVNHPPFLTYPHIEKDGKLCLQNIDGSTHTAFVQHTRELLGGAYRLLQACQNKSNRGDFQREFLSYWNRYCEQAGKHIVITNLVEPKGPNRKIFILWNNKVIVAGEDEETLKKWVANRNLEEPDPLLQPAAFIWLSQPMVPEEYPVNGKDVWKITKRYAANGRPLLDHLITQAQAHLTVVFGANMETGPCLAGITLKKPQEEKKGPKALERGFRRGKIPVHVRAERIVFGTQAFKFAKVERADEAWVYGRGINANQKTLSKKCITLVGCGSIGSQVAQTMAQSGVGKLNLIDPESLDWANITRHRLGAKSVGKAKALELESELKANYPNLTIKGHQIAAQNLLKNQPEIFLESDLVIVLTGDWAVECYLNQWFIEQNQQVKVLFGWTEEHACAGHALALVEKSPCLECWFKTRRVNRVSDWTGQVTEMQEPACGTRFQPYGQIELTNTIALVSETALDILLNKVSQPTHKIWACRRSFLEEVNGRWSQDWLNFTEGNLNGGFFVSTTWDKSMGCEICNG